MAINTFAAHHFKPNTLLALYTNGQIVSPALSSRLSILDRLVYSATVTDKLVTSISIIERRVTSIDVKLEPDN